MSHTSETNTFHLPQFTINDTVSPVDFNDAFSNIDANAVPKTRKVNNKALTNDITLTFNDVGAVPSSRTVNGKALSSNITLTASDVGAVPTSRTINNQPLSSDITLSASDIGAVPTTRKINGQPLTDDINITVEGGFLAAHPVGSIYISTSSTNPGTLFGGVWRAFAPGRVLVGVNPSDSDFSTSGKMGGSKTHTLTVNEMPKHVHTQTLHWSAQAGNSSVVSPALETNDPREYSTYPTTGETGGGQPHNNLQPYITCYMWRRSA